MRKISGVRARARFAGLAAVLCAGAWGIVAHRR